MGQEELSTRLMAPTVSKNLVKWILEMASLSRGSLRLSVILIKGKGGENSGKSMDKFVLAEESRAYLDM